MKDNKAYDKADITSWEMYLYAIMGGVMLKTFKGTDLTWLGLDMGTWMIGLGACMFVLDSTSKSKPYRKFFESTGLEIDGQVPTLIKKKKAHYGYDLIFSLPIGLSSKQFKQKQTELEDYLGGSVEISVKNKKLILQVYKEKLQENYDYKFITTKGICEFPIGYMYGNRIVTVDLEKVVHLLIAGQTGGGKSTLLRGILTSLILDKDPRKLSLHLIDLKNGAEFNVFRKSKIVKSFSRTKEEAEEVLYELIEEVDRRYDLFFQNDVVDIKEYNKLRGVKKLDYKILAIDEFADLQDEKGSISAVEILAAKARACGIHLIIATQRPDSKILNGRIKANIPCVIGLKTLNELNSRIIIDEEGLEKLRGKGHGILKFSDATEFQSMYLDVQEARDLIKHTYRKEEIQKIKPKQLAKATESQKEEKVGQVDDFGFLKMLIGGKK